VDYRQTPIPHLHRGEHGVRIDGRRAVDYDRARGLVSELLRLSEHPVEGMVYHILTGLLPVEAALSLAVRLTNELAEEVRERHVEAGLLPEPEYTLTGEPLTWAVAEAAGNPDDAHPDHWHDLGGEGG
jgi:hypothetical protein